jgi:uncharacterized protein YbcI
MAVDRRVPPVFAADRLIDMPARTTERRRQSAAIARAITIHREQYGRGPGRCRATLDSSHVCVLLEDVYTPAERTLIDAGREDVVRESRAFHDAMRSRFVAAVEEVTRRGVAAFVSQVHFDPDLSVEVFVLEPDSAG